jgi:hypothetical protein
MSFILLNPYLEGSKISSQKNNINLAADEIWTDLSKKIKNYIPEFYFSIQNSNNNKIHHVRVRETLENTKVKYNLKVLSNKKYHANDKVLLNEINKVNNMSGGRKHRHRDDDSSSSSSSSDAIVYTFPNKKNNNVPMLSLNYYPSIYGVSNILLPTFSNTFTPFVKLNIPLVSSSLIIT